MNNIEPKTIFVNRNPEKNKDFFNRTLLKLPEFVLWQGNPVQYRDGSSGYEWNAHNYEPAEHCPYGVPKTALLDKRPQVGTTGKRTPPIKKYAALYDEGAKGYVSNKTLQATALARHFERPVVQAEISDTEYMYFLGRQKGCEVYNRELADTVLAKSEALVKRNAQYFFLTVTYAVNEHGRNLCEAWQIFNLQIARLFQNLRRRYGFDYVCVFESTLKGYPHAHIVMACQKGITEDFSLKQGGDHILSGDFYQYLAKIMPSPQFTLQKADGKGLKSYLTKYISKSTQLDIFSEFPRDPKKRKAVRKNILSYLMPVLASVRQVRYSIRNYDNSGGEQLEMLDEANISGGDVTEQEMSSFLDALEVGIVNSGTASALVTLCIKLIQNCKGHVYLMSHVKRDSRFRNGLGYFDSPPAQDVAEFKLQARPLGCPGCVIYSALMKFAGIAVPELENFVRAVDSNSETITDAKSELAAMYAEMALP